MICLSIKERNLAAILDALSKSLLSEIRLDFSDLNRTDTVSVFRSKKDLIATCRITELPVEECKKRVQWAVLGSRTKKSVGKRYLDLEYDSPVEYREDLIITARKRGFKIILSYHNFNGTDSLERLIEIYNTCKERGADYIKIVTTGQNIQESIRVLKLYKEFPSENLIAFSMGQTARFTRLLSLHLGAPFVYASLESGRESASGQYSITEMERITSKKNYPNLVSKKNLIETIIAPASKSHTQRAILAAAWAKGKTTLYGYTPCADSEAALDLIKSLGVRVHVEKCKHLKLKVEINSPGIEEISVSLSKVDLFTRTVKTVELPVGESGLLSRLIIPSAGHLVGKSKGVDNIKIVGKGSLMNRILFSTSDIFSQIGMEVITQGGKLPATVKGHIKEGNVNISGSGGSQLLSGLLMALPLCDKNSSLEVQEPTSTPYVDLTIQTLKDFGITITNQDFREYKILGRQKYKAKPFYPLEGDWSGASMLFVAGAITKGVTITNLPINSKQADEKIIDVLISCGVEIKITEYPKYLVMCGDLPCAFKDDNTKELILGSKIELAKPKNQLQPFEFDATNSPDLFPSLVVLALNCNGESRIKGVNRLSNKESNRAESLYTEFTKLGATIDIDGDWMTIRGGELTEGLCCSHNDHRVAMAIITAAMTIKGKVYLDDLNCISKSFPDFLKNFN